MGFHQVLQLPHAVQRHVRLIDNSQLSAGVNVNVHGCLSWFCSNILKIPKEWLGCLHLWKYTPGSDRQSLSSTRWPSCFQQKSAQLLDWDISYCICYLLSCILSYSVHVHIHLKFHLCFLLNCNIHRSVLVDKGQWHFLYVFLIVGACCRGKPGELWLSFIQRPPDVQRGQFFFSPCLLSNITTTFC